MPKKLPIISTLIGISISTLGIAVPTFADVTAVYTFDEAAGYYAAFEKEIEESCGNPDTNSGYGTCRYNIALNYQRTDLNKYNTMYLLDILLKGFAITAYNPYAGTARLYINNDRIFTNIHQELQSLVIFWADNNYIHNDQLYSSAGQESYGRPIVDSVMRGESAPKGIHIVYNSAKGKDDWYVSRVEQRVVLDDDANFLKTSSPRMFLAMGYDIDGNQYNQSLAFNNGGECSNITKDSECQIRFYQYDGAGYGGIGVEPAAARSEDLALAERREIIKETKAIAREAEERAAEALAAVAAAEARAAAAEERAVAAEAEATAAKAEADVAKANAATAEAAAREAESVAREAESVAREAESIAREAENGAMEATAIAREAELAAREAESSARAAELRANELSAAAEAAYERANELAATASAAEAAAREAEATAREAEAAAREAEATAREAEAAARTTESTAREAMATAEKAVKNSEDFTKTSQELTDKISALNERIIAMNAAIAKVNSDTKIVEKITEKRTIEKPVMIKTTEVKEDLVTASDGSEPLPTSSEPLMSSDDQYVEVPNAGKEAEFPWWIIAFVFSGIALTLWWFIPARKKD